MPGGSWQDGWCRGAFEQAEADTTSDPTVLLPRWARGARLRVCGAMLRAQCLCGATLSVWRHAPCVAPCSVCGAMRLADRAYDRGTGDTSFLVRHAQRGNSTVGSEVVSPLFLQCPVAPSRIPIRVPRI